MIAPSLVVHVVIPVYNRLKYTQKCLLQLQEQTWKKLNVIVIDDGSLDGTSMMVEEEFPDAILLCADGGLYWTGAVHLGVEHALKCASHEDFILVLNDDLIFENNFVAELVNTAKQHPKALIHASNSFVDDPETIDFGGLHINWWTAKFQWLNRGRKRRDFSMGHCEPSSVLWGRGLLIPVHVFHEIGNYDRRIVHRGDPEFPRRAAKAGYELLVAYDVVAYMYREETTHINERRAYSLTEIGSYFIGVLSQGNLKVLFWSAMLMTNSRLQGIVYFGFSIMRNLWHFGRHVRRIN